MYKVTCLHGGKTYTLHDPLSDDLRIYNDQLETETNKPGQLQFDIPFDHAYKNHIVGLSSDIRVYDGNEEIWRGRPIDDGEDLYRARSFKCEGELAFLYDSIQPRRELHNVSPLEFFTLLINEHNTQVGTSGPIDKRFTVGVVTVTDSNNSLYRYTNRETTYDCILDKLVGRLGGYIRTRVTNGVRYIDYLADVDTVSDQPIQLGDNLLDYSSDTDYTQVATACIPLGASLDETEIDALDAYLTVESVNNNSDTIQIATAVQRYGFICKVLKFDDITVASNLKAAGQNWLTDGQYETMTLNLTAVDLHALGYDVMPIRINTQVRVVSDSHGMDRYFPVTKRTYHLTQPETDTVTFGSTESRSYTSEAHTAVKKQAEEIKRNIDTVIEGERQNISSILNQATHGYVVLDPISGPSRILIMDTNNVNTAQKIWKWDANGLGYSSTGINGPWGIAITMNGQISADYIATGEIDASLIKAGTISDVNGINYWDMETGEFALSSSSTIGGKTVSALISEALADIDEPEELTQQKIFNLLTNNGQTQGIYLQNGKVYINASYIGAGIISDNNGNPLINLTTGKINLNGQVSANNNFIIGSDGKIKAVGGEFSGKITADDGTIGGIAINNNYLRWGDNVAAQNYLSLCTPYSLSQNGYYGDVYVGQNGISTSGYDRGYGTGQVWSAQLYWGILQFKVGGYIVGGIQAGGGSFGSHTSNSLQLGIYGVSGNKAITLNSSQVIVDSDAYFHDNLYVSGTKNRVVQTKDFGERLFYCYEMPSPIFGDIGEGIIGEDGLAYIDIDPIFEQAINSTQYHVFLQPYDDGKCFVKERRKNYFTVKGDAGLSFSWEIKAKQASFDQQRFDAIPYNHDNIDYGMYSAEYVTENSLDYGSLGEDYVSYAKEEMLK